MSELLLDVLVDADRRRFAPRQLRLPTPSRWHVKVCR
jgi:hypothetical protein